MSAQAPQHFLRRQIKKIAIFSVQDDIHLLNM